MKKNKKLSVIIPTYNTPHILKNILIIIEEVKGITDDYEIIIVDDGSNSFPYISQNDYVKVITHKNNMGKGKSLMDGFKMAEGEVICFIDADLQIPVNLIKPYYEIMMGSRMPDVLIGSKRHRGSKVKYPFTRRVMSVGYQTLIKYLFGLCLLDTQCGIKFFQRNVIKKVLPKLSVKRFAIDVEILFIAQKYGFKILEAPVTIKQHFTSTINPRAVIQMLQDTLAIWYRSKFLKFYDR